MEIEEAKSFLDYFPDLKLSLGVILFFSGANCSLGDVRPKSPTNIIGGGVRLLGDILHLQLELGPVHSWESKLFLRIPGKPGGKDPGTMPYVPRSVVSDFYTQGDYFNLFN